MNDKDQVIKHLEMIQGVINRLARNSFFMKGWSMTILAAAILFISRYQNHPQWIMLSFLLLVIGFWGLDAYFLWKERLFREHYDVVRKKEKTDFGMKIQNQKNQIICKYLQSFFSLTLLLFYGIEIVFIGVVFLTLM